MVITEAKILVPEGGKSFLMASFPFLERSPMLKGRGREGSVFVRVLSVMEIGGKVVEKGMDRKVRMK